MARISCENRHKRVRVDIPLMKKAALAASGLLGLKEDTGINIIFVSSQMIRSYNQKYLGKDSATDVIAFGDAGRDTESDIVISSDRARANAKAYGTTLRSEMALYVIHGILHFAGYRDGSPPEISKMRKAEKEILEEAGIKKI
ncbi:MAG: rRNA maturation RNase YbeY [Candidatus Omnitrophica bacterium]|nr:rRNA maturation RNase YbeY [Candidatus Omnitrophota bacterium]